MPLKTDDVERSLQSKFGFAPDPDRERSHRWYVLRLEGLAPIRTKFSRGSQTINDSLASAIARQLHVRRAFLVEMVSCRRSREDYYSQLRTDPVPPFRDYGS